jgi:hypothetical protein
VSRLVWQFASRLREGAQSRKGHAALAEGKSSHARTLEHGVVGTLGNCGVVAECNLLASRLALSRCLVEDAVIWAGYCSRWFVGQCPASACCTCMHKLQSVNAYVVTTSIVWSLHAQDTHVRMHGQVDTLILYLLLITT